MYSPPEEFRWRRRRCLCETCHSTEKVVTSTKKPNQVVGTASSVIKRVEQTSINYTRLVGKDINVRVWSDSNTPTVGFAHNLSCIFQLRQFYFLALVLIKIIESDSFMQYFSGESQSPGRRSLFRNNRRIEFRMVLFDAGWNYKPIFRKARGGVKGGEPLWNLRGVGR